MIYPSSSESSRKEVYKLHCERKKKNKSTYRRWLLVMLLTDCSTFSLGWISPFAGPEAMMTPTSVAAGEQRIARGHLKRPKTKSELRGTAKGQAFIRGFLVSLFFFPKGGERNKPYQYTFKHQKDKKKEWEKKTSSALTRHLLFKKGLLTFFCPENGYNFHASSSKFQVSFQDQI